MEKRHFNKWCWENWTAPWKRMKMRTLQYHTQKQTQKGIKDLNVRLDTMKLRGKQAEHSLK